MTSFAAIARGLRIAFRRPAITLAEIAWRWSFVAAAWILGLMFLFEYMDSLPVNRVDRLLLATNQPVLVERAIQRIFQGSGFRFVEAGALLLIGLAVGWIVLASVGRLTTVKAILDEFGLCESERGRGMVANVAGLNVLRVSATLSAIVAAIGAVLISNSLWASTHISVAGATRLFFSLFFLVCIAWLVLNWTLSVAAIVSAAAAKPPVSAIEATMRLCQLEPGAMFLTGSIFGVAHLGAFVAASGIGLTLLAMLKSVPSLIMPAEVLVIAGYCAVADFIHTARMAAYVAIIRADEMPVLSSKIIVPVVPPLAEWSPIDKDELILSDVPLPAS